MGEYTLNSFFWKPSLGASGAAELALFDDALDATDLAIKANLDALAAKQPLDTALTNISALTYVSASFIKLTANDTYAVKTLAEVKTDLSLVIGTDVLAEQTIGIADDNLVEIDHASVADDDYAKFTANGLEGRSYAEVLSDIGAANSGANSSITSLTGLTTPLGAAYGGTGVANNAASTLTISGNFAITLTVTEATGITLPASGTLATTAVATLSSLTSIGTIATGTWEATDIGLAHGGTGVSTGAMVNFTSILNATLYIGRDADNQIKFATDNNIIFRLAGVDGALFNSTGELDMNAHTVGFTLQTATGDGTTTIDWKLGNHFKFTFGAQADTLTFTAPTNPGHLYLIVKQDATGGRDLTFPVTVTWLQTEPTWTDGGAAKTIIVGLVWDGVTYWAGATEWET